MKSTEETIPNLRRCTRNELFGSECRKATEIKSQVYLLMLPKHRMRTSEKKNIQRAEEEGEKDTQKEENGLS